MNIDKIFFQIARIGNGASVLRNLDLPKIAGIDTNVGPDNSVSTAFLLDGIGKAFIACPKGTSIATSELDLHKTFLHKLNFETGQGLFGRRIFTRIQSTALN